MAFNWNDNPLKDVRVIQSLEEAEIEEGLHEAIKQNDVQGFLKQLFTNYEITRKEV